MSESAGRVTRVKTCANNDCEWQGRTHKHPPLDLIAKHAGRVTREVLDERRDHVAQCNNGDACERLELTRTEYLQLDASLRAAWDALAEIAAISPFEGSAVDAIDRAQAIARESLPVDWGK